MNSFTYSPTTKKTNQFAVHSGKLVMGCVVWLFYGSLAVAQKPADLPVSFRAVWDTTALVAGQYYSLSAQDSIQFDNLKFYISKLELLKQGKAIYTQPDRYYLVDITDTLSLQLNLEKVPANFDALSFTLGTDSVTNVAGVMGGDLDPTNGMYWSWQSGYINVKIEGESNQCLTPKHRFQFHLGGYTHPFQTVQTVVLPVLNTKAINIDIDLRKMISVIDLKTQNNIVIPGLAAKTIAQYFATAFYLKP